MTVYRRSGAKSWSVLVETGRDSNGRRRRFYEGGFRTKREAQAKELEVKTELANGSRVDHSNMTVAEYIEELASAAQPRSQADDRPVLYRQPEEVRDPPPRRYPTPRTEPPPG